MNYSKFIEELVKMEKAGKFDMETRYELMNMGFELSMDSFNRGLNAK